MAKKYNNGIVSPKGFDMAAPEPSDQRDIVEFYTDLATLNQTYPGIEVKVEEQDYAKYKLLALPSSTLANWELVESGEGIQGPPGPQGDPGADGKSAYELYVDNGGTLTEQDWLLSLEGEDGIPGDPGPAGPEGPTGAPGQDGEAGPWGSITGNIVDQTDLQVALDNKSPLIYDGVTTSFSILAQDPSTFLGELWFASDTKCAYKAVTPQTTGIPIWQEICLEYEPSNDTFKLSSTGDGQTLNLGQEVFFSAFNNNGSGATALTPKVFIANNVLVGQENVKTVIKASKDDLATGALYGLNTVDAGVGEYTKIVVFGDINDVDTSAWSVGTLLYASDIAGELTDIKPSIQAFVIGKVSKSDPTSGIISVNTLGAESQVSTVGVGFDRVYATGEEVVLPGGTFYLAKTGDVGSVDSVTVTAVAGDNQIVQLSQDLITEPYPLSIPFDEGLYSGQTEFSVNFDNNSQRFYYEYYLTDIDGVPIDSGLPVNVGTLGVRPILYGVSQLTDAPSNTTSFTQHQAQLQEPYLVNAGQRIRVVISAEKVGSAGGNYTYTAYYGFLHSSYTDTPKFTVVSDNIDVDTTGSLPGYFLKYGLNGVWSGNAITITDVSNLETVLRDKKHVDPETYEFARHTGSVFHNQDLQEVQILAGDDPNLGGIHGFQWIDELGYLFALPRTTGALNYIVRFNNLDDLTDFTVADISVPGYNNGDQIVWSPTKKKLYTSMGDTGYTQTAFKIVEIDPETLLHTVVITDDSGSLIGSPACQELNGEFFTGNSYYGAYLYKYDLTSYTRTGKSDIPVSGSGNGLHNIVTDGKKIWTSSAWTWAPTQHTFNRVNPATMIVEETLNIAAAPTSPGSGGFTDDGLIVGDYLYMGSEWETGGNYIIKIDKANMSDWVKLRVPTPNEDAHMYAMQYFNGKIWYTGSEGMVGAYFPATKQAHLYENRFSEDVNELIITGNVALVAGSSFPYPVNAGSTFVGRQAPPITPILSVQLGADGEVMETRDLISRVATVRENMAFETGAGDTVGGLTTFPSNVYNVPAAGGLLLTRSNGESVELGDGGVYVEASRARMIGSAAQINSLQGDGLRNVVVNSDGTLAAAEPGVAWKSSATDALDYPLPDTQAWVKLGSLELSVVEELGAGDIVNLVANLKTVNASTRGGTIDIGFGENSLEPVAGAFVNIAIKPETNGTIPASVALSSVGSVQGNTIDVYARYSTQDPLGTGVFAPELDGTGFTHEATAFLPGGGGGIGGSIADGQLAFGNGADAIQGSPKLAYDTSTDVLDLGADKIVLKTDIASGTDLNSGTIYRGGSPYIGTTNNGDTYPNFWAGLWSGGDWTTHGTSGTNTGIGTWAMSSVGTGMSENTGIGAGAMTYLGSGSMNTGVGASVLGSMTTGTRNTGLGRQAGVWVTSGENNTLLGSTAGFSQTGGGNLTLIDQATLIGSFTDGTQGSVNETVVGYSASGNGSNTVTIGNAAVTDFFIGQGPTTGSGYDPSYWNDNYTQSPVRVRPYALGFDVEMTVLSVFGGGTDKWRLSNSSTSVTDRGGNLTFTPAHGQNQVAITFEAEDGGEAGIDFFIVDYLDMNDARLEKFTRDTFQDNQTSNASYTAIQSGQLRYVNSATDRTISFNDMEQEEIGATVRIVKQGAGNITFTPAENTTFNGGTGSIVLDTLNAGLEFVKLTPAQVGGDNWSVTAFGAQSGGSGGLANIVEDTTPQLGGTLDVQSNDIYSAGGSTISIGNGRANTGVVNTGYVNFFSKEVRIGSWDSASSRGEVQVSYDDFGGLDMTFSDITNGTDATISYFGLGDGFVVKDAGNWNFSSAVVSGMNIDTIAEATGQTIATSDMGRTIFSTAATSQTYTIPDTLNEGAGATFTLVVEGAGTVTVTTSGTATINGSTSFDVVIIGPVNNKINAVQFIQRTASSDDWIAIGAY